ncbi:MAG: alpha/beta hydrolase fold domain-containing protein [Planctomycetota bacterium]|nr:alpha/beta hydrolase fold domain-containing protein [Planctomycetota bacterium]
MTKIHVKCLIVLIAALLMAVSAVDARADAAIEIENLAYGSSVPGNLLDLYLPDVHEAAKLPLIIWLSGSAWYSNTTKDYGSAVAIAEKFTARGYAVATTSIRSSLDARFPAQGYDVRAAIRWLRENAAEYDIDPNRFAFMGDSSGGWAAAFAATTSDIMELPGEEGVNGTSSAVQVAVSFFPATDFLSMDEFAEENNLPININYYPHNSPTSPVGLLIQCPGEPAPVLPLTTTANPDLVSIQDCPVETEAADPSSYIDGAEVPIWLLHGLADSILPYNQSQLVYDTTTAAGNKAKFTLVPSAGHSFNDIIGAAAATTWITNRDGLETVVEGAGPSWDDIDQFLRSNLSVPEPSTFAGLMALCLAGLLRRARREH